MSIRELLARVVDRLRRDRLTAELDEEMRYHRALLERDARYSSRTDDAPPRQIGNVTFYKEEARDMWSLGLVDDLLQDLRFAARVLRREAGFTAAVIVTLALGIGANTAAFSIVNAVLLRPLPYAHPEQLVSVWTAPSGTPTDRNPSSLPDILDWQRRATVFQGLAGFAFNRFDLTGPEGTDQARAILGTASLYDVLGAHALIGRLPRPDEERLPVVAISHRLWLERFGGERSVIGSRLVMNGQPYTVVGVLPPGFHYPTPEIELFTTLYSIVSAPDASGANPWLTSRSLHGYHVVGRLRPDVTLERAEREVNAIEHRLASAYPTEDGGIDIHLQSVSDDSARAVRGGLWTVFGAAALVLLLACVNVAHLLLARMSGRARELALRRALGAHRGRVLRQLAAESLLLGALGGAVGIGVAVVATRALVRLSPGDIPRLENVSIDVATLAFATLVSLLASMLFGVAPAVLGWGRDMHGALRGQGGGSRDAVHGGRTRSALTALEVAFAVLLLVGAGLMLRSFARLTATDLGVQSVNVWAAQLNLGGSRYTTNGAKTRALDAVLRELRAVPGVAAAGGSTSMPPTHIQEIEGLRIEGQPAPTPGHEPTAIYIPTSPGFLEALHIGITSGRAFDVRDDSAGAPVALVNRELVRRHFPRVNPVGQRIETGGETRTIVGVTGDAVYEGLDVPVKPTIYVPFAQRPFAGVWIAISGAVDQRALTAALRDIYRRVDPELPVRPPVALESMIARSIVRPRFNTWLLGTFGALALVLASVGIYGVIAYGVSQRRAEIGIRLALGAPARSVATMVLGTGMRPVLAGLVIGLGAAWLGGRLIAGLLYGITPTDGFTFAGVSIVLIATAMLAAWAPARRAARVDPLTAIRAE
jgi:putative ABC transport system permease protein